MAKYAAYKHTAREVQAYEGYDEATGKITPVQLEEGPELHGILDNLTLAIEAGVVDKWRWPQQFFANKKSFGHFIEALADYDDCYRITDRWWQALATLVGTSDEEGFVSSREIAEKLHEHCVEDGLLDWGKGRKLRYTLEQYHAAQLVAWYGGGLGHHAGRDYSAQRAAEAITRYCEDYSDYASLQKEVLDAEYERGEADADAIRKAAAAKEAVATK